MVVGEERLVIRREEGRESGELLDSFASFEEVFARLLGLEFARELGGVLAGGGGYGGAAAAEGGGGEEEGRRAVTEERG